MKSKEALKLLKVSRVTLSSYVKSGLIKVTKLANGYYDYHDDSIYAFLGKNIRFNVIYARVSTYKQKNDLKKQIDRLNKYCDSNIIAIEKIFSDVSSGIDFDRPNFTKLLDLIFEKKIDTVYITYKDRLSRLSFITLESIFNKFGTKIVPIYQRDNINYDELFDEVTSMMHYFSTKKYSKRKNNNN
jgi:putative resolvase